MKKYLLILILLFISCSPEKITTITKGETITKIDTITIVDTVVITDTIVVVDTVTVVDTVIIGGTTFKCPTLLEIPSSLVGTVNSPFQGDILVDQNKQVGVITELWDNRVIPLYFDTRWSEEDKEIIRGYLTSYIEMGFTFPEISFDSAFSANPIDHIYIKYSGSSVSYIGKEGGEQELYLTYNKQSDIIHEMGHAVGLHHPHVTDMQDEWLTIYWDNIIEENKSFFKMYSQYSDGDNNQHEGFEYGDKYDIYSVMNYPSNAYAIDISKPTMTLKDGTWFEPQDTLSEGDKISINRMYECFKNRK